MKLNRTRRGLLALAILLIVSVGVGSRPKGFVNGEWSNVQFMAHFISNLTRLDVIFMAVCLGVAFAFLGPKDD